MNFGQIYKIHSDFYYVMLNGTLTECKLRENIKKQKQNISVGDFVEVLDGFIVKIQPRKNFIKRPNVANLDILLVVASLKEPDLDFVQLNRYLIFAKYHKIETVICINKNDLKDDHNELSKVIEIYEPLGYKIFFTSAKNHIGIETLKEYLKGKTIAMCGNSGVGKTSLINNLFPEVDLRTKTISSKTKRGVHTTRHCEIIENNELKIVDTPCFSQVRFDFILPYELSELFDEIKALKNNCKYKDCTHTTEDNCSVLSNLAQIAKTRYESYLEFLKEAKEFKQKVQNEGRKKEFLHKENLDKIITKISAKKRAKSRKTINQNIEIDSSIDI